MKPQFKGGPVLRPPADPKHHDHTIDEVCYGEEHTSLATLE